MLKAFGLLLLFVVPSLSVAQDGAVVEKTTYTVHDSVWLRLQAMDAGLATKLKDSVDFFRITYLSDGL